MLPPHDPSSALGGPPPRSGLTPLSEGPTPPSVLRAEAEGDPRARTSRSVPRSGPPSAPATAPRVSSNGGSPGGGGFRRVELVVPGTVGIPVYDLITGEHKEDIIVPDDIPTDVTARLMQLTTAGQTGLNEEAFANMREAILDLCRTNPAYAHWTVEDVRSRWPGIKTQLRIIQAFFASLDLSDES